VSGRFDLRLFLFKDDLAGLEAVDDDGFFFGLGADLDGLVFGFSVGEF